MRDHPPLGAPVSRPAWQARRKRKRRRSPQACIRSRPGRRCRRMSANVSWFRANGFLLALIGAVILAFLFPSGGGNGAWIPPVFVTNGGIALILFFQGLSLAFGKVKAGAGNWRLHLVIQAFTFGVFPLLGILLDHI